MNLHSKLAIYSVPLLASIGALFAFTNPSFMKNPEGDIITNAFITVGTPAWADHDEDKNGKDSNLYCYLTVTTTDGRKFTGYAEAGNNTGIGTSHCISLPITWSKSKTPYKSGDITYQNVVSYDFQIVYQKPNQGPDENDTWKAVAEATIQFQNNQILSTGQSVWMEIHFNKIAHGWYPWHHGLDNATITRAMMINKVQMKDGEIK